MIAAIADTPRIVLASAGSTITTVLIVVGGLFLVVLFFSLVRRITLAAIKRPLTERVAKRYDVASVLKSDYTANSFGLESRGATQARGNGVLVLTNAELAFFQFMPNRDDIVPLPSITETSLVRSHLGKATIYDLLKVVFEVDGRRDSIAIFVPKAAEWKQAVDEQRTRAA